MFQRKNPAQLAAQLQELKGGSSYNQGDNKEWKMTLDTAGNGTAVIRFLPGKTENDLPFIKLVNHGFKIGQKWYIETCTSTHGDFDNCPVCQYISENDLYNTNNKLYGNLKRKTSFWANILVVKDPAAPANEGKVFKYRFGSKIMDKINSMVDVDTEIGEVPVDVTCPFEGANFIMKVKKVSGFSNYDDCKFQKQSAIPNIEDEDFQKKLADDMVDIGAMVAPSEFNSLEKNKAEFLKVMGTAALGGAASEAHKQADELADELDDIDSQMEKFESSQSSQPSGSTSDEIDDILNDI